MQLPLSLINSLTGIEGFNEAAFIDIHQSGSQITSLRRNPYKIRKDSLDNHFKEILEQPVSWSKYGYYLSQRPSFTFDPLFHAGCYYVQEASSMFLEQTLKQTVDLSKPLKVLDLCAAPGGKSTHLQSLISADSLLVSNEIIRQRVNILKDNIIKWGSSNVVVTSNDAKDFSKLKGYFDVIIVDAPCSGSGLFRKDEAAVKEWSENNVTLCSQRQQRILADVMPALKENGVLIYATCSYSKEEGEEIADWLTREFQISNLKLEIKNDWSITEVQTTSNNYCYRFWPHLAKGEGFFLAVFQNKNTGVYKSKHRVATRSSTSQLAPVIEKWANISGCELIQVNDKVYAWYSILFNEFDFLLQHLRVIYSGVLLGEMAHKKFIPDHALAMNLMVSEQVKKFELSLPDAIAYLQKNTLSVSVSTHGWQLAAYKNFPLGWMNILSNRINNYYPKELRILRR